jgi:hypothetical protein
VSQDGGSVATLTRLGRAVRATADRVGAARSQHREEHRQTNWLRDVILGGQDGLVNILGIVLGLGAAAIGFAIGHLFHAVS